MITVDSGFRADSTHYIKFVKQDIGAEIHSSFCEKELRCSRRSTSSDDDEEDSSHE